MLPAEGVGAFVYEDYSLLADDAVAALRKARQLAGARLGRIGWVPLPLPA
jgi:uncharacterized protein